MPSTATQLVFQRALVDELQALGLDDAALDEHGYVMATVPATTKKPRCRRSDSSRTWTPRRRCSGADVMPIVHERYDGRDIVLPDDPHGGPAARGQPGLAEQIGHDIVTASGTTLLGADDKAGVAEIVSAAAFLMAHPDIPHGVVRLAFTPDEEIGRGATHFDVARFGCRCAYTLDGGGRGEVESESFSADAMTLDLPRLQHASRLREGPHGERDQSRGGLRPPPPRDRLSPETTDGYDGFVHPYVQQSGVDRTAVKLHRARLRDGRPERKESLIEQLARETVERHPGSRVDVTDRGTVPEHEDGARRAPRSRRIRARGRAARGSRGPVHAHSRAARTARGCRSWACPRPNLFAGEHNFHSRLEWVSRQDMEKAVDVIVELCRVWERRTPE